MEIAFTLLLLCCSGAGIAFARSAIEKQRTVTLEDFQQKTKELQSQLEHAKLRLEDLEREKQSLQNKIVLAKQEKEQEEMRRLQARSGPTSPEEWLLATGKITSDQIRKAKSIMQKAQNPLPLLDTCLVLGFIDKKTSDEATSRSRILG